MTSDRTVDAYVERLPADQQRIVGALRQLIKSAAPSASESIKWAQPVYEAHGPFAYIKAHRAHVTLGFWLRQRHSGDGDSSAGESRGEAQPRAGKSSVKASASGARGQF